MKRGYLIRVKSWENDLDNRNSAEYHTENPKLAEGLCRLFELFKPDSKISNIYDGDHTLDKELENALKEFDSEFPDLVKDYFNLSDEELDNSFEDKYDSYMDILWDFALTSEHFTTRVCEEVECFHIRETVTAEKIDLDSIK